MESPTAPEGGRAQTRLYENVTSPFDGMLPDDLVVERSDWGLKVVTNGCPSSIAGFERKLPKANPQIHGKDVTLDAAVREAARLIGGSTQPLFGGLATDVEGMRALLALAECSGGVIDHALSDVQFRNMKVLQSVGWITTTLTEARNRADLIIVAGSDLAKFHPRFFETVVLPPASMFDVPAKKRTVVFIGKGLDAALKGSDAAEVVTLPCRVEDASRVIGALRARLRGFRIADKKIAGVPLAAIDKLAETCRVAKYGVVVWAPPALDFPHAELAIDQFTGLVKDFNPTIRFAGLSLGGGEGVVTASAVCTWITGYPLRVSFALGLPDYDPYRYSIRRMLAEGEGDLLVWTAAISPTLSPPPTKLPAVVLGTPGLKLERAPAVFIPVGTPGLDHEGRLIRVDNVVSLAMKNLGRAALPSVADVVAQIEAAL